MKHQLSKAFFILDNAPKHIIAGAVFVITLGALVPSWLNYDIIARDRAHLYVPVTKLLLQGRFHEALFGSYNPLFPLPLYEFFISVVARFSGLSLETSGRLVAVMAFVGGSFGIYIDTFLIAKDRSYALLSVILYLSNKQLLKNSVDCLKESLLVGIIIWGNCFIIWGLISNRKAV
jgi:hypothetical protein